MEGDARKSPTTSRRALPTTPMRAPVSAALSSGPPGDGTPARGAAPMASPHRSVAAGWEPHDPRPPVAEVQSYVDALVNSVSQTVGRTGELRVTVRLRGAEIEVVSSPMAAAAAPCPGCHGHVPAVVAGPMQGAAAPPSAMLSPGSRTRDEDYDTVQRCLHDCGSLSLEFGFFISHVQREATDFAAVFATHLEAESGLACWLDRNLDTVNAGSMVRGVARAAVFVIVLTKSYFHSKFCNLELRAAMYLGKPIVVVHEEKADLQGYAPFDKYFEGCPNDLAKIKEIQSRPIRRQKYELNALVQQVLRDTEKELRKARDAKRPLQVLDPSVTRTLLELGNTAGCYVDLGSGQSVVYLLAIAADSSLEYQLVLETKGCFLDKDDAQREALRADFVRAFHDVGARLKALGGSLTNLFHVCIGATAKYRLWSEAGGEKKAGVDRVETWFRSVVAEAGIDTVDRGPDRKPRTPRITFETLVPRDEARFEWMAVKTAVNEVFAGSRCDAVLAAGKGSIQVSMQHEFESTPQGLGADVLKMIQEKGVDSYRNSIRPHVRAAFGGIAERLMAEPRPLGIVLISSFFYAACACKVASKNEFPHYRDASELLVPAQQLLDAYELNKRPEGQDTTDACNVARLLEVLDIVTSNNPEGVKVLIVREWKVRGKNYKATWATGKFLTDMRLIAVDDAVARRTSGNTTRSTARVLSDTAGGDGGDAIAEDDEEDGDDVLRIRTRPRAGSTSGGALGREYDDNEVNGSSV